MAVVGTLAAKDLGSSVGTNLALFKQDTGLDPLAIGPGHLRAALMAADRVMVPDGDKCLTWSHISRGRTRRADKFTSHELARTV